MVQLLQLTDSFFPVGAFAYSDGLESAASSGRVHDGDTLKIWLHGFLDHVFTPCEGLALLQCVRAIRKEDFDELRRIDEELTAIKPATSIRNSSRSIGKRLLTAYSGICDPCNPVPAMWNTMPNCNASVAYALVLTHRNIEERDAVLAFGYTRLTGLVSAALRLISLGQQQAQKLLTEALETLPSTADRIFQIQFEPIRTFAPSMDIAQMNHRYLYSRLFRS